MKVLIVEDSKVLANVLARKIQAIDGITVDVKNNMRETYVALDCNHYDLILLDLHLPDAEEEMLVDIFLERELPTVVMTSSLNHELREQISRKDIIDYVLKNRSESIDYLVHLVNRLYKNRSHTILVVDDSAIYRHEIQKTLNKYMLRTIIAKNGQEALDLERENENISLVITDYEMPKVDGLEVVLSLRQKYKKYELPIIGVSTQKENAIAFLKYGVNDFIRKPFFKEELSTRVNNTLDSIENVKKLNDYANTDFLTGVANRKYFYAQVTDYFAKAKIKHESFAIAMLDIDYFKLINDNYGHDIGDKVIKTLAQTIKDNIKGQDIVARFGGEEFCVLLKDIHKEAAFSFFESLRKKISRQKIELDNDHIRFTVSIGVATNPQKDLDATIKQSDLALYQAKNSGRNKVCVDFMEESTREYEEV